MPIRRRSLFPALGGALAAPLSAQPLARMRAVPPAERQEVQVGAGTQGDVTAGASGPQDDAGGEGAAAGSLSASQPGSGSGHASRGGASTPPRGEGAR